MATEFQKASKGKIVSDTPATQELERIKEEASIEAAAARAGKSPEEIKAEAKAAGTDPISWIKDKYPPSGMPKKPAERAPAEPVADQIETPEEKATRLQKIQSQVKAGTYNPVEGIAASLGVPEEAASKTVAETVNKSLDDYRQKRPPPATAKGILSGVVEDVAQETGISSSQLSKALDVIESKAKLSGESLEQVAKRIPDPRLRSALGLIAVGLAGFAIGRGTDKKKESGAASTGFNEAAKKRLEELRRKKAGK